MFCFSEHQSALGSLYHSESRVSGLTTTSCLNQIEYQCLGPASASPLVQIPFLHFIDLSVFNGWDGSLYLSSTKSTGSLSFDDTKSFLSSSHALIQISEDSLSLSSDISSSEPLMD
ncbi:hypothetical protein Tco_0411767 [Tanacetum coccineum]